MDLIQSIFVVFGLVYFVDGLFFKWNVWDRLQKAGMKAKHKFFYDLVSCRFCLLFHLSIVMTIVYGLFSSFFLALLIVPCVVGGLIRNKENNGL